MWHHKRLFKHIPPAVRTARRNLQQVLGFHWIRAGDAIKKIIEKELRVFGIAILAKCDEVLRPSHYAIRNEYDDLFLGNSGKVLVCHEHAPTQARSQKCPFAESPRYSALLMKLQRDDVDRPDRAGWTIAVAMISGHLP
jgi:hypothetical protein